MYRYFELRNAAWKLLIDSGVNQLPIDLHKILKFLHYEIKPYDFKDNIRGAQAIMPDGTQAILVSRNSNEQQKRFTIAHEIGHIFLQHIDDVEDIEKEANSFGARLLMPVGILNEINITKAEDIAKVCNVTIKSAEFRAKRIEELAIRNKYKSSNLEIVLINQFKDFINNFNKNNN